MAETDSLTWKQANVQRQHYLNTGNGEAESRLYDSVECLDFGLIIDCIYVVTSFESWSTVNHFHDIKLDFST